MHGPTIFTLLPALRHELPREASAWSSTQPQMEVKSDSKSHRLGRAALHLSPTTTGRQDPPSPETPIQSVLGPSSNLPS